MMKPKHSPFPGEEETQQLVADLLAGVAVAPAALAAAFLDPLTNRLCRQFPTTDPALCATAAAEAIWCVIRPPSRFDPTRCALDRFLCVVGKRKLLNLRAQEARHAQAISLEFVAEPDSGGKSVPREAAASWDDPRLTAELAGFNTTEYAVFEMMRSGERKTTAFSQVLGLSGGSAQEQASNVKRYKEKLMKRLTRAVRGAK